MREMRQGDGADLLGVNDPRSANVGIIYVAPNDDRQTVLTAILTQDKLGRKQVAVVLPGQNKAFQRPVDFEGLKNMRRGLKTEIVFIAPNGPGPAEFARHRHFDVFPSLEAYGQTFQTNEKVPAAGRRGLFGRRQKPTNGMTPTHSTNSSEPERTLSPPVMVPVPIPEEKNSPQPGAISQEKEEEQPDQDGSNNTNGAAINGEAVLAPDLLDGPTVANTTPSPGSEEDWDALPPSPDENRQGVDNLPPDDTSTHASDSANDSQGNAGPGIIVFPTSQTRSRTTGKLPAAVAPAAVPTPPAQPKELPTVPLVKRRNTGKSAAIGAGAVAAGAAAGAGAGLASRTASTGGTPPPPGGNTGGSGGGGGGSPRRRINRSLLAVLLIVLTLLLVAGIAFAAPGGLSRLSNVIPGSSPGATVTITPVRHDLKDAFLITAVTGTPDPNQRQIPARKLFYATPPQSNTVKATGTGQIPATFATGTLTFFNALTFSQTVGAGTVLRGADGVQVMNTQPASIPAANPPTEGSVTVSARAVQAGASGNIRFLDINGACCLTGVTVQNRTGFGGGKNASTFVAVSQNDINGAANPLKTSQLQSAQRALQAQIKGNEQLVNAPHCSTNVTSNHKAGDRATSVTVTVTATCTGEVFDQQAARNMATSLLMAVAQKNFGNGYVLLDNKVVTDITSASVIDAKGTVSLNIKAEGIWFYQFSDTAKQNLAKLIAGKSEADAKRLLLQQPGVSDVQITIASGTTLPTDPTNISIVIKSVPGLPGTPTATPTPTSPTATPTAQPGLGGS